MEYRCLAGKDGGKIGIPRRVASSLGILEKYNHLSSFFLQVNNSGYTFKLTTLRSSTEKSRMLIKCEDGNEIIQLLAPQQSIIWQQISRIRLQVFYVDTDLARSESVGRELAETIAIVPFNPYSDEDTPAYTKPKLDWRRVIKQNLRSVLSDLRLVLEGL